MMRICASQRGACKKLLQDGHAKRMLCTAGLSSIHDVNQAAGLLKDDQNSTFQQIVPFRRFAVSADEVSADDIGSNTTQSQQPVISRMDFPGGSVPFSSQLRFIGGAMSPFSPTACYRTLDSTGKHHTGH